MLFATSKQARHPNVGVVPIIIHIMLIALFGGCGESGPTLPEFGEERTFSDHREIDVRFESGDAVLAGTVHLPLTGGPHPAVAVNPGSSWTVRATWSDVQPFVSQIGTGVLTYDKRRNGQSTGTCCSSDPNELFSMLADDVVAAAQALRAVGDIDPSRIGVIGSSQGGWIVPISANRAPEVISFSVVTVGGAVSTGQENLYDPLTGYDICQPTGSTINEIIDQLKAAGPSGFDPRASLEALAQPAIWIFGENDLSHPTALAVEILEEIRGVFQKDWTIVVLPNANHDLIENGTICQTEGPLADVFTPLRDWFAKEFP